MGINQFRAFALQSMCDEHLWKPGESYKFTLKGREYEISMDEEDYRFSMKENGNLPMFFPNTNRLFAFIFKSRMISY